MNWRRPARRVVALPVALALAATATLLLLTDTQTSVGGFRATTLVIRAPIRTVDAPALAVEAPALRVVAEPLDMQRPRPPPSPHHHRRPTPPAITVPADVLFGFGNWRLTDQSRVQLGQIARLIRRHRSAHQIEVDGHTDAKAQPCLTSPFRGDVRVRSPAHCVECSANTPRR
jgi:outer membrane protein OmpA-like peptidoglycan-associated protein